MPRTVQQPAQVRLIASERRRPVTVTLRYDVVDPLAVHVVFPSEATIDEAPVTWTFARDLLEEGLAGPAGRGDVRIWPGGPGRTVIEFDAPEGMALVEFDEAVLRGFLLDAYDAVPVGSEDVTADVDRGLAELFRRV
ncbi:sporulation-specific cell division protein SsgB [Streptomyces sulfonofaciens]|uniref:Sporulation-specific cell division protein SsgB n=1 Tax=Streptomyces sulfonofaciens TaxID=68272 RepID=A0A919FUX2_9ACTN|nr:SsgA family sporulation/cell division regulator [Streptomyces sulfonofaciens]GHH72890.1 sporulation-specific cell division protein SsgB [Streptomyces sulfonofaciens]